ncbi:hypothetical protein EVAR_12706_1 [Eumeta japonica]|uniref:Uncharacterized protein n=1 Tax=Eumeta variegata TaxID=151549 RepID=A0A4C1UNX4_EUMVA|nr:hypothetical protein EVAR_12706_1 [Eumeta japonica]
MAYFLAGSGGPLQPRGPGLQPNQPIALQWCFSAEDYGWLAAGELPITFIFIQIKPFSSNLEQRVKLSVPVVITTFVRLIDGLRSQSVPTGSCAYAVRPSVCHGFEELFASWGPLTVRNVRARRLIVRLQYDARNPAAVKLVTIASQWRKMGMRATRIKGRGESNSRITSFAGNTEQQSFVLQASCQECEHVPGQHVPTLCPNALEFSLNMRKISQHYKRLAELLHTRESPWSENGRGWFQTFSSDTVGGLSVECRLYANVQVILTPSAGKLQAMVTEMNCSVLSPVWLTDDS